MFFHFLINKDLKINKYKSSFIIKDLIDFKVKLELYVNKNYSKLKFR